MTKYLIIWRGMEVRTYRVRGKAIWYGIAVAKGEGTKFDTEEQAAECKGKLSWILRASDGGKGGP
jgi:hypothetical protein